jgi:DNA repair protein RadC
MFARELAIVYVRRLGESTDRVWRLHSPLDAASVLRRPLQAEPVEVLGVLCLTTKQELIGYHEVSRGTLNASIVHPREVFKAAVLSNAAAVIVAHNHPSGDPAPSPEDVQLTERLREAGQLLGIDLLDHIVIGHDDRYFSFRGAGRL